MQNGTRQSLPLEGEGGSRSETDEEKGGTF